MESYYQGDKRYLSKIKLNKGIGDTTMVITGKALTMTLELLFKLFIGTVLGYFMWKFKKIEDQAAQAMDEQKTRRLIDDKLESLQVQHKEVKEDLNRIEGKLDRLIEK